VTALDSLLATIKENAPAVIDLPGKSGLNFRSRAVLQKKEFPHLMLIFPLNAWDADLLLGELCNLSVEHEGQQINLVVRLDEIVDERRLRCTVQQSILPESLREYFRVSINLPIEASYVAGPREIKVKSWKLSGSTLDLSGSGVLAVFTEKPPSERQIQLVLTLGEEDDERIVCLANVVRCYRVRKNRYQVAFHFDIISSNARDQIIACCLQEQRRQLREMAQLDS
jgi:c-di-GMP-binding flagellar brake protein YcgR